MIKKIAAALLVLTLIISAATVLAQMAPNAAAAIPPEVLEALAKEPPLTQADVEAYLKIMPEMPKAMNDPSILIKAYEGAGLTEVRFSYVVSKIALAQAMSMGASAEQLGLDRLPEVLRPTEADRELVNKNKEALGKAAEEMTRAMSSN